MISISKRPVTEISWFVFSKVLQQAKKLSMLVSGDW
jgi:hypothetical protein